MDKIYHSSNKDTWTIILILWLKVYNPIKKSNRYNTVGC